VQDLADSTAGRSVVLADHTTIRLGGPAQRFVRAATRDDLVEDVRAADDAGETVLVLGGGSNLIVADAGFAGTVVRVAHTGITFDRDGERAVAHVAAGESWDDVVLAGLAEGLAGLECLSGIPGLAGATPIQNVGAYGAEVSQVVTAVQAFDRAARREVVLSAADCRFGYRTSALKGADRYVVLGVDIELRRDAMSAPVRYAELASALGIEPGERAPVADVRAAVLALRSAKGMLIDALDPDSVSAGSFFTNPVLPAAQLPAGAPAWPTDDGLVKTSAAWLIEQAGFGRGFGDGLVGLSRKHTLAIVNRGGATTAELLAFAARIKNGVAARFGIELEVEPALVGVTL
jgi:UDP-N-acetylmuramate dehydrogenase